MLNVAESFTRRKALAKPIGLCGRRRLQ
jgi:hypothetical protein